MGQWCVDAVLWLCGAAGWLCFHSLIVCMVSYPLFLLAGYPPLTLVAVVFATSFVLAVGSLIVGVLCLLVIRPW
jgi:hypothetical protein